MREKRISKSEDGEIDIEALSLWLLYKDKKYNVKENKNVDMRLLVA